MILSVVLFLVPHRPNLHRFHQVGLNWIYISWNRSQAADNVSNYLVRYSYGGACSEISRQEITRILDSSNSSYNATDLAGPYLNYSITLIAINDTGSSPPNVASAVTHPTSMFFIISDCACSFSCKLFFTAPTGAPQMFMPSLVFSTNITVQWQSVRCSKRNSEITHYLVQDRGSSVMVPGTNRTHTVTRLQPLFAYTFTIAAVNSRRQRGPNTTVTVTTSVPESKINHNIFVILY